MLRSIESTNFPLIYHEKGAIEGSFFNLTSGKLGLYHTYQPISTTKGAIPIEKRTISGRIGKEHSLAHNNRDFVADNVDRNRIKDNIVIIKENIEDVYHELFDEAMSEYNSKQKRKDRIIKDYYDHIRHSRQERDFHEVIFQIGNMDDTAVNSETGKTAAEIMKQFAEEFQQRNPQLRVFNAVIHMDEETPHLHLDFVPFATGQKRELSTRVSLTKALEQQDGFKGEGKFNTACKLWIDSEKQRLSELMLTRGIEWEQLGTYNEHLSVLDFKKQERSKEVARLENKLECTDYLIEQRKFLLNDVEAVIDRLDGDYQQKKEAISKVEAELSDKSATLAETTAAVAENMTILEQTAEKAAVIVDIDSVPVKETLFGGKITISKEDYDRISTIAKKHVTAVSHEKELNDEINKINDDKKTLNDKNVELTAKVEVLKKQVYSLDSVKASLKSVQNELDEWKHKYNKILEFIESLNLKEKLDRFLHPITHHKSR